MIQELLLIAVHGHLFAALTLTEPEVTPDETSTLVGLSEFTHVAPNAA